MPMHPAESKFEEHTARQLEIIANFTAKGFPTNQAERLLQNFEERQRYHVEHLTRLQTSKRSAMVLR
jgi:hypothetical protein